MILREMLLHSRLLILEIKLVKSSAIVIKKENIKVKALLTLFFIGRYVLIRFIARCLLFFCSNKGCAWFRLCDKLDVVNTHKQKILN